MNRIANGNLVIQERDGNNLPVVTYTRGKDLSGGMEGAGGIGGLLARSDHRQMAIGDVRASALYHAEGNGNVTALASTNGLLLGAYYYDPYGNLLGLSGAAAEANLYRFSSKEFHGDSGLYYYGYRFYDPNAQRWLNRDPIGEAGFKRIIGRTVWSRAEEFNLYQFNRNDPVTRSDALGLCSIRRPCCTITWTCGPGMFMWIPPVCSHVCTVAAIAGTCCPTGVGVGSVDGRGKLTPWFYGCRGPFTWTERKYK